MLSLRYILINKEGRIMEELLGFGIGYAAIFLPALILFVIFFFDNKTKKDKYNAMIEISKNLEDPSKIKELLENFKEKQQQPIDYRRSGVITLFVGLGLFLFGMLFIEKNVDQLLLSNILRGVGLLVGAIGVGSIIAGYLYPNESAEITKAVEKFEKE
jgi:hypothetical protein|tara:strand:+ start:462 stop:935 length:474 start_codon:yes stop_codon:yes gene_type:complete